MEISWSSLSAGAMTAAVSLGSTLHTVGSGAASVAASALPAAPAMPQTLAAGAAGTTQLAQHLAMVEKPVAAAAQGARSVSTLARVAGFLGKALPVVTIAASVMSGAQIVQKHGFDALIETKKGRGAVLGAVGGSLLLLPFPPAKLAAAGMLGLTAANQLDGLHALDRSQITGKPVSLPSK